MNKLLVIVGPTAIGKTKRALELAKQWNGELVSADSRQVYIGMDIGTGKGLKDSIQDSRFTIQANFNERIFTLSPYIVDDIPVWLYDVVNPDEDFSVSHYQTLARAVIGDIHSRGKLPILVGGTGFYVKAMTEGIQTIDIPRNEKLRRELETKTVPKLQSLLQKVAPALWDQMNHSDKQNPRRLIRKLEIIRSRPSLPLAPPAKPLATQGRSPPTRRTKGGYPSIPSYPPVFDILTIGLKADIAFLRERIARRVEERLKEGIIEEIRGLLRRGYSWNLPAMNTLGYKEWKSYLENPMEEEKQNAIGQWTMDEIHYAQKQMTWFRKQKGIEWVDISDPMHTEELRDRIRVWYTSM